MLDSLLGQTLGHYQIVEMLGEGGMGAVFRARDVTLQRDVALKVMHPQAARQRGFPDRFLQEARAAARLDHPGIVKVHDFGEAEGLLYIVMEHISGDSLRTALDNLEGSQRRLPLPEALQLVRQVCLALDYAHRRGILHRDVKPDNIMLKPEPAEGLPYRPVLTDLGLARLLDSTGLTQDGTSLGTPAYMSPEQALGERTDARSDVYSLGILMYELAVGRRPFPVRTLTEAIRCHTKEPPPPPRSLRPELPEALEKVILRALAKPPGERYPDAAAMAEALAAAAEPAPGRSGAPATQVRTPVPPGPPPAGDAPPAVPASVGDRIAYVDAGGSPRQHAITRVDVTIGSDAGNDLALGYASVSGQHARVVWDGACYRVTDLNSLHGTYLGSTRLLPGVPQVWNPGTALRVGDCWLRLERGAEGDAAGALQGSMAGAPTGGAEGRAGCVAAFMEARELSVDPGGSTTTTISVVNQGAVVDHFQVSAVGIPAAWVPAPPLTRLLPGARQQVTLAIRPPRVPESKAGSYSFSVRVASQDAPDQAVELDARLAVSAFQQFQVELYPQRQRGWQAGRFRLQISNWGNAELRPHLTGVDAEEACAYTFETTQPTVPPGQQSVVRLTIKPKGRLPDDTARVHRFTVTVRPPDNPLLAQQVHGEWEQAPRSAAARRAVGCGFWVLWTLATALGSVLGGLALILVDYGPIKEQLGRPLSHALLYGSLGAGIAILQSLTLRRHLRHAGLWFIATLVGFMLYGYVVGYLFLPDEPGLIALAIGPALLGASQWPVLWRRVRWSGLWIAASVLGWMGDLAAVVMIRGGWELGSLGWRLAEAAGPWVFESLDRGGVPVDLFLDRLGWALVWVMIGAAAGVITGLAMLFLLSHPAEEGEAAEAV